MRAGIDLGGTKIEGILLDKNGHETFRKRIPTRQENGYAGILDRIAGLYAELLKAAGSHPPTLGIGTPGAISPKTGLLKNSNTQCLNAKPLGADLAKKLGVPLVFENDANCFALAEATLGAGRGKNMVFGIIMGTGCGGGLVIQGRLHRGLQSIGGEWGHMAIDPQGPLCYCGARGCVETLISGGGLQKRFELDTGETKSFEEIVARARAGEIFAKKFFARFLKDFGRAVANLINVLDPDVIVLGGGVSNLEELYTVGYQEIEKQVFSDSLETPVVRHVLGDSAGVIGAALVGAGVRA